MSDRDRLLAHEYDGIEEYDNPLPGWWSWLFVATIVFSLGYYVYYQLGPGPTIIAQYEEEARAAAAQQARLAPAAAGASEDQLRALAKDARAMAAAKEVFATRCAVCHGPEGQGLIGPNLTDDYWLHGGTPRRDPAHDQRGRAGQGDGAVEGSAQARRAEPDGGLRGHALRHQSAESEASRRA